MTLFDPCEASEPSLNSDARRVVHESEPGFTAIEDRSSRPGDADRSKSVRVVLGLCYDGTDFRGFAIQKSQPSVAGVLVEALETITGKSCRITCAGRTDAGVHAIAQVVHVDLDADFLSRARSGPFLYGESLPWLLRALSKLVGPKVSLFEASVAHPGFDARRSATYRRYRYDVDVSKSCDPRRRNLAWHVGRPLDLALMRLASDPLIGEHDFAGFCRRAPGREQGPIIRVVSMARWYVTRSGQTLSFEIQAGSFCHQMVRSIVGSLVAIGEGSVRPSEIQARIVSATRERAPTLAPARGLTLIEVGYPPDLGGPRSLYGSIGNPD